MKMNRAEFVSRLETVYPGVGINRMVPEYKYVQISQGMIWAENGAMVIRTKLRGASDFECGVLGKPFLSLLRSVDSEEIELTHAGKSVHVTAGKVSAVFDNYPRKYTQDVVTPDYVCTDANAISQLVEGLAACKFAVSKYEGCGALCGVLLDEDVVLSSDRYRIALWRLGTRLPGMRCSIPDTLVDVMRRVRSDISAIGYCPDPANPARRIPSFYRREDIPTTVLNSGRIKILLRGGTCIVAVTHFGKVPDLASFFQDTGSPYVEVSYPEQIMSIWDRHSRISGGAGPLGRPFSFHVHKDKCVLVSEREGIGRLTEEWDASSGVDSQVNFDVSPHLLRDVLPRFSGFKYFVAEHRLLFESDGLQCLVNGISEMAAPSDSPRNRVEPPRIQRPAKQAKGDTQIPATAAH